MRLRAPADLVKFAPDNVVDGSALGPAGRSDICQKASSQL